MAEPIFLGCPAYEIEPVVWQHRAGYNLPIDVTTQVFSNHTGGLVVGESPTLVFPGYGEHEWAAKRGLDFLTELGVPALAAVMNADMIPATHQDIESFIRNVGPAVAADLRQRTSLQEKAPTIGHSLGGAVAGLAVAEDPDSFGKLGLLEAVGTTAQALTERYPNENARRQAFVRRFAQVLTAPNIVPPLQLARAGRAIGGHLRRDLWPRTDRRFRTQFAIAAELDTIPNVLSHAEAGNLTAVIVGARDPLINPVETYVSIEHHYNTRPFEESDQGVGYIISNLDETYWQFGDNLHMRITPQRHAYMGFAAGKRQLEAAAEMLHLGTRGR